MKTMTAIMTTWTVKPDGLGGEKCDLDNNLPEDRSVNIKIRVER